MGSLRKKWCKKAENLIDWLCFFMKYASFFHKKRTFLWFSTLKNPTFSLFWSCFCSFWGRFRSFRGCFHSFTSVFAVFGQLFLKQKAQISLLFKKCLSLYSILYSKPKIFFLFFVFFLYIYNGYIYNM